MCRLVGGRFRRIGNNQVLISEWQPKPVLLQRIERSDDVSLHGDRQTEGGRTGARVVFEKHESQVQRLARRPKTVPSQMPNRDSHHFGRLFRLGFQVSRRQQVS